MSACARPRLGHTLGRTLGQGLVEDRDGGVDLLAGHSHWRRDAKDVGRGTPSDVQACSELQATSAHCEAELARGGLGLTVLYQLHAEQQPPPADITDGLVALLERERLLLTYTCRVPVHAPRGHPGR